MGTTPDARAFLQVYLNDHRAGAAGGLALARRCLDNNGDSALGETLRRLVRDIEQDTEELDRIIDRLGVAANLPKRVLAVTAERVGRLKLNARLTGYSPLSRLLEVEMLLAGIDAKRSLWCALGSSTAADDLSDVDFTLLAERATEQRSALHPHHREAARAVFGDAADRKILDVQERVATEKSEPQDW